MCDTIAVPLSPAVLHLRCLSPGGTIPSGCGLAPRGGSRRGRGGSAGGRSSAVLSSSSSVLRASSEDRGRPNSRRRTMAAVPETQPAGRPPSERRCNNGGGLSRPPVARCRPDRAGWMRDAVSMATGRNSGLRRSYGTPQSDEIYDLHLRRRYMDMNNSTDWAGDA